MKIFSFLVVSLLTAQVWARETLLETMIAPAQQQYAIVGHGQNQISVVYADSAAADDEAVVGEAMSIFSLLSAPMELRVRESQVQALAKCVFMVKGVQANHLSEEQSQELAETFLSSLENEMILSPSVYLVTKTQFENKASNCAVLLYGKLNAEFALMSTTTAR